MIKIFVAGAYNGSNSIECLDNIKRGLKVCAYLMSQGHLPFCPWTDFLFHLVSGFDWEPSLEQYRAYCLELISMSDLVFIISGLKTHEGVQAELKHALSNGIPVALYDKATNSIKCKWVGTNKLDIYTDLWNAIQVSRL